MKPRRPKSKKTAPSNGRRSNDAKARPAAGANAAKASGAIKLVQIEKPIYGGNFLARDEGKAVFVPMTLPGEQARVRFVEDKSKRGYAVAEVDELITAAAERVQPLCPHFGPCGGCHYQHAGCDAQLQIKRAVLRETLERGGVAPPDEIAVLAGEPWGYRNRIRLAFDTAGNVGYRGRRSHAVVPMHECPIAAPLLVRAALQAAEVARTFAPALRPTEIALFCDAEETTLLISLFAERPAKIRFDEFAQAVHERVPQLSGAELVIEGSGPESPRTLAQWGATLLTYSAAGFGYRVDHGAFFQVNRRLVDLLVGRVADGRRGALAWDLFAGVGLFARRLTGGFERVIAVEAAPSAKAALAANLQGTTGEAVSAATLDFLVRNRNRARPDLIVVDPPRAGLGADVTALLAEIATPAMVYVSCDPATLARDLRALLAGGYAIESMTLADLFPQTFHLETVVHLRRA
jgi:23S rRNA (uracil1939-C5)-methyltransferase